MFLEVQESHPNGVDDDFYKSYTLTHRDTTNIPKRYGYVEWRKKKNKDIKDDGGTTRTVWTIPFLVLSERVQQVDTVVKVKVRLHLRVPVEGQKTVWVVKVEVLFVLVFGFT